MKTVLGLAVVAGLATLASADPVVVFSSDFESGAPAQMGGGGGVEGSQGLSAVGFGSNLWRNDGFSSTTLSLDNLPAHTSLSLTLLFAAIDSWDGIGGSPGPDAFEIRVDGTAVWNYVFASASGSSNYPGAATAAGGYGWNSYNEWVYSLTNEAALTDIAHTADSARIEFVAVGPGWQGGFDESFGIDNVEVTVDAIPAPGAVALAGIAGLVGLRRRR